MISTKIIYFSNAVFTEEVYFHEANFLGIVKFSGVTFSEVDFYKAIFSGEIDFTGAIFKEVAYFGEVLFLGSVRFDGARFLGSVSFKDADFSPDFLANCLDPYKMISFRRVSFEVQKNVIFDGTDMRRVSFIHVDLERVRFRNVKWEECYDGKLLILKNSWREKENFFKEKKKHLEILLNNESKLKEELRHKFNQLYKEKEVLERMLLENLEITEADMTRLNILKRFLDKDRWKKEVEKTLLNFNELRNEYNEKLVRDEDLTMDNVLTVLRGLRENYDYYLKYEESGKFFVEEMDLKRKLAFKKRTRSISSFFANFLESSILLLYRWLCLYGESIARPIIWIPVIILAFALTPVISIFLSTVSKLLLDQLNFPSFIEFLLEHWNVNTAKFFLTRLKISAEAFFQLKWDGKITTLIERLISIPTLGSLYISLKRKLERKIRH
ncbi:MAG: pentapeptide repeat-containing protein [Candidatus Odinarchaeota archaeon]|nr:pentapeptide repeat-containing protein [Candidatus Odinarchaeota archaeon]